MARYELAQLNIAQLLAPLDSPQLADFVAQLDEINALADKAPGFIWRWKSHEEDPALATPLGDMVIINLSVWQDQASLHQYVYNTAHAEVMKRRREWFSRLGTAHMVLWWIVAGRYPSVAEALGVLNHFREVGPSTRAFSFKQNVPPPA